MGLSPVVTALSSDTRQSPEDPGQFLFADMPASAPLDSQARLERESEEFAIAVRDNGPLLLPAIAARVVGLSQQRVSALLDSGKLTAVEFFGHKWVYLRQLQARQAAPKHKGGRPLKIA